MVENIVAIELAYINTKHPDFHKDAALVPSLIKADNIMDPYGHQQQMRRSNTPRAVNSSPQVMAAHNLHQQREMQQQQQQQHQNEAGEHVSSIHNVMDVYFNRIFILKYRITLTRILHQLIPIIGSPIFYRQHPIIVQKVLRIQIKIHRYTIIIQR